MHDGASPYFTLPIRNYLNENYPKGWVGRGAITSINYPLSFPDLMPLEFFLWGTSKENVCYTAIATQKELWESIIDCWRVVPNLNAFKSVRYYLTCQAKWQTPWTRINIVSSLNFVSDISCIQVQKSYIDRWKRCIMSSPLVWIAFRI